MKKKKGYTLIEMLAVIFILSFILIGSKSIIGYYGKTSRELEIENFLISVEHLLTEGKSIAIKEESILKILFDKEAERVKLTKGTEEISCVSIPKYIGISSGATINITSGGQISSQTTIIINTKDNEKYNLIVRVGVDYIKVEKT